MTPDERASVVVVEDEAALAESIEYNLRREGFDVELAHDGRRGLDLAKRPGVVLVILDLMIPELAGLDVLRELRVASHVPVIIVTAKDAEADVVAGLELGADDYVTKPFSMRELVSRVRANVRRHRLAPPGGNGGDVLHGGPVVLDVGRHEATVAGETVSLRPKEFELLETLLRRKGRLVTRDSLIEEVWGFDYFGDTKTLDVHIKRLRKKLEADPSQPRLILTVRGLGYKYADV